MAVDTMATTTTLAGEQSPTLRLKTSPAASTSTPSEPQEQDDQFFWTYTEEPHRSRRMAIIKAHPEVWRYVQPNPLLGDD